VAVDRIASTVAPLEQSVYFIEGSRKADLLLALLRDGKIDRALVFTRTKHRAKRIGQQLDKAGYKAASLQGNLSQNKRQEALDGFRSGKYQILVATDIAARGIDVSSISHVINYDIPDTVDAYTHRIGRTGRAAKTGDAFTFITHEDEPLVRSIERVLGEKIGRRTELGFDYTKAAPKRDEEFARPPREPQRRRTAAPARPEQGRARSAAPGARGQQASAGHSAGRSSSASPQRPSSGQPRPAGSHRGPGDSRPAGGSWRPRRGPGAAGGSR